MGSKRLLSLAGILGALALSRLGGADTVVLNLDFESASYTLGARVPAADNDYTPPLTWTLGNVPAQGDITTVAPVIANGGTKAMLFTDTGTAGAPSAILAGPIGAANGSAGVSVGTLDLDYHLIAGTHANLQYMRLLTSETSSSGVNTALGLRFGTSGTTFSVEKWDSAGAQTQTPIGISPPTASVDYHFTISFNSTTSLFSVTEVENPGPSQVVYTLTDQPYNGTATVKRIGFGSGSAPTPVYQIDNIILEIQTAGPEVEVKDGSTNIADGGGPVDFGSAAVGAPALSKTFTVNNLGTADLTTSNLTVPTGYTIAGALSATISAGGSATFTIELPTTTAGTFTGDISFDNNDSDENPFSFSVTGTITPVGPEVEVKDGATNIVDGGGPVDFGVAMLGAAPLSKTFTVNNLGTTALTTSLLSVPAGYSIAEPLSASIPAGGSDTFTVELPTTAGGTFSGQISFENNDSDENPFNFSITGTIQTVSRAKEWNKFD